MGKLTLVLGGARSGKSSFAEELAAARGEEVIYIATARAGDGEMEERIRLHRESRPTAWQTVEEPLQVAEVIKEYGQSQVILVDCLTLLVSNLLFEDYVEQADMEEQRRQEQRVLAEIEKILITIQGVRAEVILVANEVGLGLVPPYPLGRLYRDLAGRVNQLAGRYADEVYFTIAGIPIELKELHKKLAEKLGGE